MGAHHSLRATRGVHQQLGHRFGEAATWDSLGYAHHHLGHHTQVLACCRHALGLYRDLGNRHSEAETLIGWSRRRAAVRG